MLRNFTPKPLAAALWVVASCCLIAAPKPEKRTLEIDGRTHEYLVFVPESAKPEAPLILLLHGSGRDAHSILNPWRKIASKEGIFLAAPSARDSAGWQNPLDGPEPLLRIIDAMATKTGADRQRVYLFGHSAGAVFALLMSVWSPDTFAAIAIHAGAFPRGSEAQVGPALERTKRKTPVHIQVGTNDAFFPLDEVRRTKALFDAAAFPAELKEIPRHDHDYYRISDKVNAEAWAFLGSKSRKSLSN